VWKFLIRVLKKKSGEVWRNVSFFRLFKRTPKWFQTIKYPKLVSKKSKLNTHLYAAKRANAVDNRRTNVLTSELFKRLNFDCCRLADEILLKEEGFN
jgi:hypothetical protein